MTRARRIGNIERAARYAAAVINAVRTTRAERAQREREDAATPRNARLVVNLTGETITATRCEQCETNWVGTLTTCPACASTRVSIAPIYYPTR